ncbi:non-canonical purine NTP pyrophosphatase, partial [Candidatus Micrarchaeota archaeon]|nr:non-canonical purine NTP pyrophosphatase [Candidatus Micrarchaeota archaeon]
MKKIFLVTTNEGKVIEAKGILKGVGVEHFPAEVTEIKSISMEETITEKAKTAYSMVKKAVVVEDTGFFLDAYKDFPGTYTKFCVTLIGLGGFLKLLEGKKRGAKFVTMIALYDGKKTKVFKGEVKGRVSESIREPVPKKLPFDAIFMPE